MDDHADVPIQPQDIDPKNIFGLFGVDIGHAKNFFGVPDALFSRNKFRRLPVFLFGFHDCVSWYFDWDWFDNKQTLTKLLRVVALLLGDFSIKEKCIRNPAS